MYALLSDRKLYGTYRSLKVAMTQRLRYHLDDCRIVEIKNQHDIDKFISPESSAYYDVMYRLEHNITGKTNF